MRRLRASVAGMAVLLVTAMPGQAQDGRGWPERMAFGGDFRYRHEGIYADVLDSAGNAVSAPDRLRHRIRARLTATANINTYWSAGLRLVTSSPSSADVGDPISTNEDLGGGLAPKTVWIDRAYAAFTPVDELTLTGGKFGVPYHHTDLHFDPDLNLEGIALNAEGTSRGALLLPFMRAGGFWLQERAAGPDQAMFGGQIGVWFQQEAATVTAAVAYYDYTNLKGHPTLSTANRGFGNTLAGNRYANDFDIIDANLKVQFAIRGAETAVMGNFVQNIAADSADTGWLAGVVVKGNDPVDWDFGYNYRVLERDAVIGAFTDSDFAGSGTNAEGHRIWLGITPVTSTRLGVTWFINQRDPAGSNLHYERLMADIELRF